VHADPTDLAANNGKQAYMSGIGSPSPASVRLQAKFSGQSGASGSQATEQMPIGVTASSPGRSPRKGAQMPSLPVIELEHAAPRSFAGWTGHVGAQTGSPVAPGGAVKQWRLGSQSGPLQGSDEASSLPAPAAWLFEPPEPEAWVLVAAPPLPPAAGSSETSS